MSTRSSLGNWSWAVTCGVWALVVISTSAALTKAAEAQTAVRSAAISAPGQSAPARASESDDHALLDATVAQNSLMSSVIKADVEKQLRDARTEMASDPAGVEKVLKMTLGRVLRAPELTSELRAQLRGMIAAALREADRRALEKEQRDIELEQARSAAEERLRITQSLDRDQEKIKQLMERFDSLMSEGRFLLAEEAAASEVQAMAPNNPVSVAAVLDARTTRYVSQRTSPTPRAAKRWSTVWPKSSLRTFRSRTISRSSTPTPAFGKSSPCGARNGRISPRPTSRTRRGPPPESARRLEEPTSLDFVEAPLQDVMDYLKDLHNIEIQIDTKALEDASIGADTPVTVSLKGIRLKSALRLMLGNLDLTYFIKNEVLMITTPEKAGNELVTKVYPVADLVIPIQIMRMGGGMGGFGMGGGGGGGMGGRGGGMGGMGMGGMGMGGMGMGGMGGGGFFSVRDDASHLRAAQQ